MAVTKRGDKGSSLTYQEMDDNFDAIAPRTSADGAIQIPAGGTGQRPGTPQEGYLRFNTASKQFEAFQGTVWTGISGGSGTPGIQGLQGLQGFQGVQGVQGWQGVQGIQGMQGIQGVQGWTGNTGPQGITGGRGVQGYDGGQGVQGYLGSTGLQGNTGPQGVQGFEGGTGAQGWTGAQGIQGFEGGTGTQGVQGLQGFIGQTGIGLQGIQGITGQTGTQGADGAQGMQGISGNAAGGAQGIQGMQGVQGVQGITGDIGPAGPQGISQAGPQGTTGIQGADGVQGFDGAGATGAQGPEGSQGVQGIQGYDGAQGITGSGIQGSAGSPGPQGATGIQGDDGAQGTTGAGVQGVQGLQGFNGAPGLQGSDGASVQGVQGVTGDEGTPGAQGATGIQGNDGAQGITGSGVQGDTGIQGVQGIQGISQAGPQGTTGLQGDAGVQGFTGTQGITGTQGTTGNINSVTSITFDGATYDTVLTFDEPSSNNQTLWLPPRSGRLAIADGDTNFTEEMKFSSATTGAPHLFLTQTELVASNSNGPKITLEKQRYDSINSNRNGDELGRIDFAGHRNGNVDQVYASIIGISAIDNNPGPSGWIEFEVSDMNANAITKMMTVFGGTGSNQFHQGVRIDAGNLWIAPYVDSYNGSITFEQSSGLDTVLRASTTGTPIAGIHNYLPREGGTILTTNNFNYENAVGMTTIPSGLEIQLDDDTAIAATLDFYKNSTTPAVGDYLGILGFRGENSSGGTLSFADIRARTSNVTQASERGYLVFASRVGGTVSDIAYIGDNNVQGIEINYGDLYLSDVTSGNIIFEGSTDNGFETTLTVTDPTQDNTITFPDATGTVALTSDLTGAFSVLSTFNIDPVVSEVGAGFGWNVDISGKYMIIGAPDIDDATYTGAGEAYIFDVATGYLVHTLVNPNAFNTSFLDRFGNAVGISGNYAIVGAYSEDESGGSGSGKAYIFDVTSGTVLHTLDNPNAYNTASGDSFSLDAVAICGKYSIVGAYQEDSLVGASSGYAYIFNNETGALVHSIANPNSDTASATDHFASAVAISEQYAVVGARYEDTGSAGNAGVVYVFDVSDASLVHTIQNPASNPVSDFFGWSVDIEGNFIAIGAYNASVGGSGASGKAFVFDARTGTLVHEIDNPNGGVDERFGNAVAISGNYIAVGAPYVDGTGSSSQSGKVYVFDISTGSLVETIDNPNAASTEDNDRFSWGALSMSGNNILVGARYEDVGGSAAGAAYLFNTSANPYTYSPYEISTFATGYTDADVDTHLNRSSASSSQVLSWNGSDYAWISPTSGTDLVNDTTPQLGGNLDLNNRNIEMNSSNQLFFNMVNPIVNIQGTGTGSNDTPTLNLIPPSTNYQSQIKLHTNSLGTYHDIMNDYGHLYIRTNDANPISLQTNGTTRLSIAQSGGVSISSSLAVNGISYPTSDGTNGQVMTTDGSGTLSFTTISGGSSTPSITASLLHVFDNPNTAGDTDYDEFSDSLDICGNYVAIAAPMDDAPGGSPVQSGSVHIFDANTGEKLHTILNPNFDGDAYVDRFGGNGRDETKISGNYLIVGAKNEDADGTAGQGIAYIFNIKTGELVHELQNQTQGSVLGEYMGYAVAIDGNLCASAVSQDSSNSAERPGGGDGTVSIFDVKTGNLLRNIYNPGTRVRFGDALAMSNGRIAIACQYEYDATSTYNNSGVVYIYKPETGELLHTIQNPNEYGTEAQDEFGYAIDMEGSYLVASAVDEDSAAGTSSGAVYVFDVDSGTLLWTFTNPNIQTSSASDGFGEDVSISGNYVAVGAPYEDTPQSQSGVVYIYDLLTGSLVETIENPTVYGTANDDRFGERVSLSGNKLLVSARGEDDDGTTFTGKAYLFHLTNAEPYVPTGEEFDQLAEAAAFPHSFLQVEHSIINPNISNETTGNEWFGGNIEGDGEGVAISGDYFIVGSETEDTASGQGQGVAYIFESTSGNLKHVLTNPNSFANTANDWFGHSVAISGNYAVVSAPLEEYAFTSSSNVQGAGAIYVYNVTTGEMIYRLHPDFYYTMTASQSNTAAYNYFAKRLAMDGRILVVGSPDYDFPSQVSGRVHVFDVATGNQLHDIENPNKGVGDTSTDFDRFGSDVDVSGDYFIAGARTENQEPEGGGTTRQSGVAYIFETKTGRLLHTLYSPITEQHRDVGSNVQADFGSSVAICGNYAAVSAPGLDTDGTDTGRVYVYDVKSGEVLHTLKNPYARGVGTQVYKDPDSDFGRSISMSGFNLVVGAPNEEPATSDLGGGGAAYLFDVRTGKLLDKFQNPNSFDTPSESEWDDDFGSSVAIHGNRVLIGARAQSEEGTNNGNHGAVYTFLLGRERPRPYTAEEVASFAGSQPIRNDLVVGDSVIRERNFSGITTNFATTTPDIIAYRALQVAVGTLNPDFYDRNGEDILVDKLLEFDPVTNRRYIKIEDHFTANQNANTVDRGIQYIQVGYSGTTGTIVIHSKNHGVSGFGYTLTIQNAGSMSELNGNTYGAFRIDDDRFILYTDGTLATEVDGSGFSQFTGFTGYEYWTPTSSRTVGASDANEWLKLAVDLQAGYLNYDSSNSTAAETTYDAYYHIQKEVQQDFQKYSNYLATYVKSSVTYTNVSIFEDNPGLGDYAGAGDVTIGNGNDHQVININSPMIFPIYTNTERNAIPNPVQGMVIFNSTLNSIQFYSGSGWRNVSNSGV
jgi:hypothetical protein